MEANHRTPPVRDHDPDPRIIAQVLTANRRPPQVGRLWFYSADQRWKRSSEVAAMHGYPAATLTPTTQLVLAHGVNAAAALAVPAQQRQTATVRRAHRGRLPRTGRGEPRPDRAAYDHLLLTAHRRLATSRPGDDLAN